MIYIGIDPGKSGAIAIIDTDTESVTVRVFDISVYVDLIGSVCGKPCKCVLEKVGAMPNQGVVSMFNFGENYGLIQGILQAYHISYELVRPQKWKKEYSITADKNSSIAVCQRLFPEVNLKRTERCTKPHDGIAEALLMAEYAKRHM